MKSRVKLFIFSLFLFLSVPLFGDQFQYREFELLASRTETTTGSLATGSAVDSITQITNNDRTFRDRNNNDRLDKGGGDIRCYLDVTAASVADTLDVDLIGIINAKRYLIGSFTQATAISTATVLFNMAPDKLAVDWTIAGTTPSFTFNIQCSRG
jgi:hypothetical protein